MPNNMFTNIFTRQPNGDRVSNTELYERILSGGDILGQRVGNLESTYGGLNTAGDVGKRFGLDNTSVSSKFRPLRGNLQSSLARSRSSLASRIGGSTAVPEASFSPVESAYAGAFADLESAQAGEELTNQRMIAQLLQSILGQRDQFTLSKESLLSRILGQQQGAVAGMAYQGQRDREDEGSTFEDIAAGVDLASKVASLGSKIAGFF